MQRRQHYSAWRRCALVACFAVRVAYYGQYQRYWPAYKFPKMKFLCGTPKLSVRFELTKIRTSGRIFIMGQAGRPTCPDCGAPLVLALPPDGKGKHTFQCFDRDRPDPLDIDRVAGWLKSELRPPE